MTLPAIPSIELLRKAAGKIRHGSTDRGLGMDAPLDARDWGHIHAGLALLDLVIEGETEMQRVSEISRGDHVMVLRPPVLDDFSVSGAVVRVAG